jgi:2-dehydropantoate 2-reductase
VRYVIYGAGAIGGVIGARLFQHGHDVVYIARGDHYVALQRDGVRLETPDEVLNLRVPTVDGPQRLGFAPDDVVLLAMKSQDTRDALLELVGVAPRSVSVVCAQNGVENERTALRYFENVYAMCVMMPGSHLAPGVVQANSSPITGLLDLGRWPGGVDERARDIAATLNSSTFESVAREDIARWKWGKLMVNLVNAVEAVCGLDTRGGELYRLAREEGEAVLTVAGIDFASEEEAASRRGNLLSDRLIAGTERSGGSSWQSLARGTGSIETDYLSGEIVLQGRLAGVATPVNELLQRLADQMAREHRSPGFMSEDGVLAILGANRPAK